MVGVRQAVVAGRPAGLVLVEQEAAGKQEAESRTPHPRAQGKRVEPLQRVGPVRDAMRVDRSTARQTRAKVGGKRPGLRTRRQKGRWLGRCSREGPTSFAAEQCRFRRLGQLGLSLRASKLGGAQRGAPYPTKRSRA